MNAVPLPDPIAAAAALSGPGVTPPSLSGAGRRFISDIVVALGFVSPEAAEQAVEAGRRPGTTPEKVLLDSGALTEDQLARALAERYGLEHIDLSEFPVDRSAAGVLREAAARRYQAAPVGLTSDGALIVAVADPADSLGLSDIAVMTKLPVRPAVASRGQLEALLDELDFMEDPVPSGPQTIGTVIVPPDDDAPDESTQTLRIAPPATSDAEGARLDQLERELEAAREALTAAQAGHHEALNAARAEHERALQEARAKADEAVTAALGGQNEAVELERRRASEELAALREELASERTRRVEELDAERARTGAALDAERERHQRELAALRTRGEQAVEDARAAAQREVERERERHEQAVADNSAHADEKLRIERERLTVERARREELEASAAESDATSGRIAELEHELETARAALAELEQASRSAAGERDEARAVLGAQLDQARAEIEDLRAEVESKTAELEAQSAAIADSVPATDELRAELEGTRTELEGTQAELERTRAGLEDARADFERTRTDLGEARATLDDTRVELELLEDADRRAEDARAALAELREESERQAELHSLIERELKAELARAHDENGRLGIELGDLQEKIADATKAFEAMGSAERRLNEIAQGLSRAPVDDPADSAPTPRADPS